MAETAGGGRQGPQSDQGLLPVPAEPDEPHFNSPGRSSAETSRDAREATELARLRRNYSRGSSYRPQEPASGPRKPATVWGGYIEPITKFWRHQISITVEHRTCRDHLALERTFLAYLRTALALSMMGITVAQLFRLQHSPQPNPRIGFYVLGKPLACICQAAAIYTLLVGAFRAWRSQNAFARGKAISGGIEIVLIAGGMLVLLLLFFALLVAVDILKEDLD